jgi:hypothetical protein
MDKPSFKVVGRYGPDNYEGLVDSYCETHFDSLEDASFFCEANLSEFAIYMQMKIEERKKR